MKTVNILLVRKAGTIYKKEINDDTLGRLGLDKRYQVIEDKVTSLNGVPYQLVVISKSVKAEQWERMKAGTQSTRTRKPTHTKEQEQAIAKNKAWLAYQASLAAIMEEDKGGDWDNVPYSQLPTVETYFEDTFTNLHKEL